MPKSGPAGGPWQKVCPAGKRGGDRRLHFAPQKGSSKELQEAVAAFQPALAPAEVLQAGSFGGTYFRDITSKVTGQHHKDAWAELPASWLKGLDVAKQVAAPWASYDAGVNKYKAKCGNTLENWEDAGWMRPQDPYGWFQWYCRFFQGRRTADDFRQIGRWMKVCGPTGRWKGNLVAKCIAQGRAYDDASVAPAVRQSLLHWAYELNAADFQARQADILGGKGAAYFPREKLAAVHKRGKRLLAAVNQAVRKRPAAAAPASGPKRKPAAADASGKRQRRS